MTTGARYDLYDLPVPPDDNIQQTLQDCSGSSPVVLPDDETTQLVLQLTGNQFLKLFSAATAGADLLYPDESIDVVFPLRQAVDCMPTFCEAVNECVSSNVNVQITLIAIANFWGTEGGDGENPPVIETNPIIAEDCDLDNLFGACTQFVDLIDSTITDFFEIIESLTNGVEAANEILEAIPGLNWLANILDIVNVIQETFAENYAAEFTAVVRDELRCALFCACRDDCTLDWFTIADTLATLTGQAVLTIDLEDFVEFISMGAWSGAEIVYASFWFVVGMMSYGGSALGITAEQLVKISSSFLNDPDPDWILLCDCGFEWEHEITGAELQSLFEPFAGRATWSGTGWENGSTANLIQLNLASAFSTTNIYSIQTVITLPLAGVGLYQFWPGNIGVPGQVQQVSPVWFADADLTDFAVGIDNQTGNPYAGEISSVIVKGNGIDPWA